MLQATFLDCVAFDPFSFQQDCLTVSEVDVGRRWIVEAAFDVFEEAVKLCPVVPENSIRPESRGGAESGHHQV
jgi:hypothetical protein